MATSHEVLAPPATRTRDPVGNDVLSRPAGVFWGAVLLFVGILWFMDAVGIFNLAANFGEIVMPSLLVLAGLYLLSMKLLRR